jgi:hypothetical protein
LGKIKAKPMGIGGLNGTTIGKPWRFFTNEGLRENVMELNE